MTRRYPKWLCFSPLLLLLGLFFTEKVKISWAATGTSPGVAVIRYFVIPLVGFSIGGTLFLLLWAWPAFEGAMGRLNGVAAKREKSFAGIVAAGAVCVFLVLALSRYLTFHLQFFDFGVYDTKIWQISQAPMVEKFRIASTNHFQPILVLYSLLYNLFDFPGILLILQVLGTISGIIPLYLICTSKLRDPLIVSGIMLLYVSWPAVGFNALTDFHPDHLYIPILLWAFYFSENKRYLASTLVLLIGFTLKEPFILGSGFFGLYWMWKHKKYTRGLGLALFSFSVFFWVTFHLVPGAGNPREILGSSFFSYLEMTSPVTFAALVDKLVSIMKLVLGPSHLRFPFFVLYPFVFLPVLGIKELVPAIPIFLIHLGSQNPHHQNVASHYTAGVIAPVLMALIVVLSLIERKFGKKTV